MRLIKLKKKEKPINREKQLKKLKRQELLELLLEQTKRTEELEIQLEKANAALNDKELQISEAGSIAEACLSLNKIFETAQAAADQYLQNVKSLTSLPDKPEKEAEK